MNAPAAPRSVSWSALLIAMAAVAWAGLSAYERLDRRLEPDVPLDHVLVEARLPGVSAGELERTLTEPVEDALLAVAGVVDTRAETRDGLVLIVVETTRDERVRTAVEARVARLRDELTDAFVGLDGPMLHRPSSDTVDAVVTVVPIADDAPAPRDEARALARALRDAEAVGHVELLGLEPERVALRYDDDELADAGISPLEFREYLRAQHLTAPGAYLEADDLIRPIETRARIADLAELRQLPLRDPADGDAVNLSRLLDVERGPITPRVDRVRVDGRPGLVLALRRTPGADLDAFARDVERVLASSPTAETVRADVLVSQGDDVGAEIGRFESSLVQTSLVILVLLVAVLGARAGISVALVVPVVVLTTFVALLAGGVGLDVVTLSSVILVLGLLVDNHIVMAERIDRLQHLGVGRLEAIGVARRELLGPLAAAAATTAAGFLPVVLTSEPVGEYVGGLFWVVVAALGVSLLTCFVVTPWLQPALLSRPAVEGTALESGYRGLLVAAGRRTGLVVVASVAFAVVGWWLMTTSEQVFFPAASRPLWLVELEAPVGAGDASLDATVASLEEHLADERRREDTALRRGALFLGRSAPRVAAAIPPRAFAPHAGQALLSVDPAADVEAFGARLEAWAAERDGDVRLRVRPLRLGADFEWPVSFEVRGDEAAVAAAVPEVRAALVDAGAIHVGDDWGEPIEKLRIVPDRQALAEADLTVGDVTVGMHGVIHGLPLFDVHDGDERLPVVLRARTARDDPREALADAYVYPRKGDPSLLYEVAEVTSVREHPARVRRHGVAARTVSADVIDVDDALPLELAVDAALDAAREAHPGVTIEAVGVSDSAERAQRAILDQAPWALAAILLCLLAQSRSLIDTVLTVATIPLALVGALVGLRVAGVPLSFMTTIGMTALAGLVVNNAIVMLSSIRRRLDDGAGSTRDVVVDAAVHRLRPVLLTSLCALGGTAVLYATGGPMWRPLAVTVIGGLVASTAVVLLVLPLVHAAFVARAPGR